MLSLIKKEHCENRTKGGCPTTGKESKDPKEQGVQEEGCSQGRSSRALDTDVSATHLTQATIFSLPEHLSHNSHKRSQKRTCRSEVAHTLYMLKTKTPKTLKTKQKPKQIKPQYAWKDWGPYNKKSNRILSKDTSPPGLGFRIRVWCADPAPLIVQALRSTQIITCFHF